MRTPEEQAKYEARMAKARIAQAAYVAQLKANPKDQAAKEAAAQRAHVRAEDSND